jgi:hypothetical protein
MCWPQVYGTREFHANSRTCLTSDENGLEAA